MLITIRADGRPQSSDIVYCVDGGPRRHYYERVAGSPHADWDEYRQAMIDERRLMARFTPTSATGYIHS